MENLQRIYKFSLRRTKCKCDFREEALSSIPQTCVSSAFQRLSHAFDNVNNTFDIFKSPFDIIRIIHARLV